jgi:hypothetical protein
VLSLIAHVCQQNAMHNIWDTYSIISSFHVASPRLACNKLRDNEATMVLVVGVELQNRGRMQNFRKLLLANRKA